MTYLQTDVMKVIGAFFKPLVADEPKIGIND
jgi:hypothetical protein